ncbi:MAG: TatD family hydrolase [Candidatus Symbiobacter sp.]|nr:TatD family hydrolase [Candidatus Symbiobacter sp.]
MLIDSHCHLDFPDFRDDQAEVMARAHEAGVGQMITIATKFDTLAAALGISDRYDRVYAAFGIHPHEAASTTDLSDAALTDKIMAAARHPKLVGIGETGLDYHYMHSPKDAQIRSFRAHIGVARAMQLPLIIHTREAEDDTMDILRNEMLRGYFPALIHCFSGSVGFGQAMLDLGLYLSFSGIVTFKKAESVRHMAATAPVDRILSETDSPFLAPVPHRGKRNEPAFVAQVVAELAALRGVHQSDLAGHIAANFARLFNKIPARLGKAAP